MVYCKTHKGESLHSYRKNGFYHFHLPDFALTLKNWIQQQRAAAKAAGGSVGRRGAPEPKRIRMFKGLIN